MCSSDLQVFVSTNGLLAFGAANTAFTNTDLTSSPTQATIAPFWDDLHANGGVVGSGIYYQNFDSGGANERVVIQWNKVRFFSGGTAGDTITYQAQLYADGRIQLNYLDLTSGAATSNNGASATVGIKAAGAQGADRLLLAFNNGPNGFVGTGQSTLISQLPSNDWYTVTSNGVDPIRLETSTPGDGPFEPVNTFNPRIELYDPANVLVLSGTVLGDGRNERIQTGFVPMAGTTYRVRVASEGGTFGEYFLSTGVSNVWQSGGISLLQESCVPMWMRGLRCVACGNIVDPLILRHRVMQKSGGRPLLKSRLPVPALAGHIKATAA